MHRFKRAAIIGALSLTIGGVAAVAGPIAVNIASAHTQEVKARCSENAPVGEITLSLYASSGNTVSIMGGPPISFGSSFHQIISLGDPFVSHTLSIFVVSSDGIGGGTFTSNTVGACQHVTTTTAAATTTTEKATTTTAAATTTTVQQTTTTEEQTTTTKPEETTTTGAETTTTLPSCVDGKPNPDLPEQGLVICGPADSIPTVTVPEACLDLGNGHWQYRYTLQDCTPPCTPVVNDDGSLAGVCTPPAVVEEPQSPSTDVSAPAVATPEVPQGGLPVTGSNTGWIVLFAALVFSAGLTAVIISKRRKQPAFEHVDHD